MAFQLKTREIFKPFFIDLVCSLHSHRSDLYV